MASAITIKVRPLTITLLVLIILVYLFYSSDFMASTQTPEEAIASLAKFALKNPNLNPRESLDGSIAPWHNTSNRANAIIVILCRNADLADIRHTLAQFEKRFNAYYKYPYMFLNDADFTQEFRDLTKSMTSSKTFYGLHRLGYFVLI